jgi:hypothetical protein
LIGPSPKKKKKDKKKLKLWRLPQNRRFYGKMESAQRGGLWAKHIGVKQGAIGNTLGEHIGNLERT